MNDNRLAKLCFLPPPTGTPWSGPPPDSMSLAIERNDGRLVPIEVPLFWYDPRWHRCDTDIADAVAVTVARLGICVAALRSEIASPEEQPELHLPDQREQVEGSSTSAEKTFLPRIVPYRAERYGLADRDFDHARIIDVRLAMSRDESGRFAYSPEQIQRWSATPDDAPLAGGGWVPAATFLPDVPTLKHLRGKLNQIRALSPSAAVLVSLGPYRLDQELAEILSARPDGVIVRLDDPALDGLAIAQLTQRARKACEGAGLPDFPLWVVPGPITAADAVKLVALGATAVAIDHWCNQALNELQQQMQERTRYSTRQRIDFSYVAELVDQCVGDDLRRFGGLLASTLYSAPNQRVASFDPQWAEKLGVVKV